MSSVNISDFKWSAEDNYPTTQLINHEASFSVLIALQAFSMCFFSIVFLSISLLECKISNRIFQWCWKKNGLFIVGELNVANNS